MFLSFFFELKAANTYLKIHKAAKTTFVVWRNLPKWYEICGFEFSRFKIQVPQTYSKFVCSIGSQHGAHQLTKMFMQGNRQEIATFCHENPRGPSLEPRFFQDI